jgi:hypothetical protein
VRYRVIRVRRLRFTLRRWMIVVLFVAAILAVRNELAWMRRRQIEAEIEQFAQALAAFRGKHGAGWNCRCPSRLDQAHPNQRRMW